MAKEIAIAKRAKISKAQQNMLLSVILASIIFGVAVSLTVHFIRQILFNAKVIMAEDESIVSYSNIIKTTGICEAPAGEVYNEKELRDCDPDSIEASKVPGTLRYNILENLAANKALNSVPKEVNAACINTEKNRNYTYKEMNDMLYDAENASQRSEAIERIKSCSALRIIPDALPAFKNEEALLASLNKLFLESNWQPELISPSGTAKEPVAAAGLNAISVNLAIEADANITMSVLDNIERSIREFNIGRATIEWGGDNKLILNGEATAYYTDILSVVETTNTMSEDSK